MGRSGQRNKVVLRTSPWAQACA